MDKFKTTIQPSVEIVQEIDQLGSSSVSSSDKSGNALSTSPLLSLEEMNTIDVHVCHMQACDQKIPMLLTYIGHVYFLERNIKHSQVSAEKKVSIIVNNDMTLTMHIVHAF